MFWKGELESLEYTKLSQKILILGLLLTLFFSMEMIFQSSVLAQSNVPESVGFAGYITSQEELEDTIALIQSQNLSLYRVSFRPSWLVSEGEVKGYNEGYIDYLLENTDFSVIVDGNHLYPASEKSARDAVIHWADVRARVFQTLQSYPNNSRVAVELINEYVRFDFYPRMQSLVTEIRSAGYTNPLILNKWDQAWTKIDDELNNTYQGKHFYFNSWEPAGAIANLQIALKLGIKLINTEVGASSDEYKLFNQANVDELKSFIAQTQALSVDNFTVTNLIWMNNDSDNWQGYRQYGLAFVPDPTPDPTPIPTPTTVPTVVPTPRVMSPTTKPTEAPTISPTVIPSVSASPTASVSSSPNPTNTTQDPQTLQKPVSTYLIIVVTGICIVGVISVSLLKKKRLFHSGSGKINS
jgi:hypothetical protein